MLSNPNGYETLRDATADDLILEQLPNGEYAWLRPADRRFACTLSASGDEGTGSFVAVSARQLRAHYQGVNHWLVDLCVACGQPQPVPSGIAGEHWGVA